MMGDSLFKFHFVFLMVRFINSVAHLSGRCQKMIKTLVTSSTSKNPL